LGLSWRRGHKKRRPAVNPEDASAFVYGILGLAAEGVNPRDMINGDESVFLLYPQGYCTWARRGSDAVQIQVRGNGTQSYPVTVDGLKLPLFTVVKGTTVRSEWDLDPGPLDAAAHAATGWQTMETMK
jgi:hypothetical protein